MVFPVFLMRSDDHNSHKRKGTINYFTDVTGSLFTATQFSSPANMITKFINIFSKRVAQSAKPEPCQDCECHSDENGVPYIECISCEYPTPVYFDFVSLISFFLHAWSEYT